MTEVGAACAATHPIATRAPPAIQILADAEIIARLELALPLTGRPNNVTITKDGRKAYVGLREEPGGLNVIDTALLRNVKTIPIGGDIHNVYVTPDGKFVVGGRWNQFALKYTAAGSLRKGSCIIGANGGRLTANSGCIAMNRITSNDDQQEGNDQHQVTPGYAEAQRGTYSHTAFCVRRSDLMSSASMEIICRSTKLKT
jgi:hypothetical protein